MAASLALASAIAGCAETKYEGLEAFVQAHDHDVAMTTYRVEPPDVIAISSPNVPEVDGMSHRVDSSGMINLKLLGEVKVSQLSPQEIALKLEGLLAKYYVHPVVHVAVSQHLSKKVYVFGEVTGVGPQAFTGRDTVLSVLARAQPNRMAWGSQVKVIRPSASESERREIVVDIDKMMKSGDMRGNVLLENGDIVYVPPTPLAWIGQRMQDILFPFSPALSTYQMPSNYMHATDVYEDRIERD